MGSNPLPSARKNPRGEENSSMVKWISPLASNEKFQVRLLVELLSHPLELPPFNHYRYKMELIPCRNGRHTAHMLMNQVRLLDGRHASAVLGASGQMVPAFTFRSERSELPNLKARSPDQLRYEAF